MAWSGFWIFPILVGNHKVVRLEGCHDMIFKNYSVSSVDYSQQGGRLGFEVAQVGDDEDPMDCHLCS